MCQACNRGCNTSYARWVYSISYTPHSRDAEGKTKHVQVIVYHSEVCGGISHRVHVHGGHVTIRDGHCAIRCMQGDLHRRRKLINLSFNARP